MIGAALAPTDAAAVGSLLRRARVAVPERLTALLEIESGLNDPMSVFLTVLFVEGLVHPGAMTARHAVTLFVVEMGGGALFGLAGGYALLALLRRLPAEASIFPILTFAAVLALFGLAQTLGASGFLAVYLMGIIAGTSDYRTRARMEEFYEAFAWLAQIALFLLLGLLITPHAMLAQAPAIVGRDGGADRAGAPAGLLRLPAALRLRRAGTAALPPGSGCAGRCRSTSPSSRCCRVRRMASACSASPSAPSWRRWWCRAGPSGRPAHCSATAAAKEWSLDRHRPYVRRCRPRSPRAARRQPAGAARRRHGPDGADGAARRRPPLHAEPAGVSRRRGGPRRRHGAAGRGAASPRAGDGGEILQAPSRPRPRRRGRPRTGGGNGAHAGYAARPGRPGLSRPRHYSTRQPSAVQRPLLHRGRRCGERHAGRLRRVGGASLVRDRGGTGIGPRPAHPG